MIKTRWQGRIGCFVNCFLSKNEWSGCLSYKNRNERKEKRKERIVRCLQEHLARLGGDSRDLLDGIDEGSSTEISVLQGSGGTGLLAGTDHGVLKTRVDELVLLSSVDDSATLLGGQLAASVLLDEGQELGLASLLPLAGHTAETDMGQVLEPLKVRDSNTSGVQQQVGDDNLALGDEEVMGIGGNGSVGSLANDLSLDVLDVLHTDLTLEGGGDQDIALTFHDLDGSINDLGVTETTEGALLSTVLEDGFNIKTVGIVGRDIVLTNTDNLGTIGL